MKRQSQRVVYSVWREYIGNEDTKIKAEPITILQYHERNFIFVINQKFSGISLKNFEQ